MANIIGTTGDDILNGTPQDDSINAVLGKDYVNGGDGIDTLVIDYSIANFIRGISSGGLEETQIGSFSGYYYAYRNLDFPDLVNFSNIEQFNITGTALDDSIFTGPGNDIINGGPGNDELLSRAGNDLIDGGDGIDVLGDADFSAATIDLAIDDSGKTVISLGIGDSVLNVEHFRRLITGSGNDTIDFKTRFDNYRIETGAGNDRINSGLGIDTVDGGTGIDTLVIDYSATGATGNGIDCRVGTNGGDSYAGYYTVGLYEWVNFTNIEQFNITGSDLNDMIITGVGDDVIKSGAGNDTITSGSGNDVIDGGAGIDILTDADFSAARVGLKINDLGNTVITLATGDSVSNVENFQNLTTGKGNDTITFTTRFNNNSINTGAGNDRINAGLGRDAVDGGTGIDTLVVDYSAAGATSGISSDITSSNGMGGFNGYYLVYNTVSFDQVSFSNIEQFNITGTALDDIILTGGGNDTIKGGAGNDTLIGGMGDDTLTGGAGSDRFVFDTNRVFSIADIGLDKVTDFTMSDRIVLDKTTFTELITPVGEALAVGEWARINDAVNGAALAGASAARIVFNQANGDLFYNADGLTAGLGSGGRFANLSGFKNLSNSNILLQA